jgi:hypothetical protein
VSWNEVVVRRIFVMATGRVLFAYPLPRGKRKFAHDVKCRQHAWRSEGRRLRNSAQQLARFDRLRPREGSAKPGGRRFFGLGCRRRARAADREHGPSRQNSQFFLALALHSLREGAERVMVHAQNRIEEHAYEKTPSIIRIGPGDDLR